MVGGGMVTRVMKWRCGGKWRYGDTHVIYTDLHIIMFVEKCYGMV